MKVLIETTIMFDMVSPILSVSEPSDVVTFHIIKSSRDDIGNLCIFTLFYWTSDIHGVLILFSLFLLFLLFFHH